MSRIGKAPVTIPSGVEVKVNGSAVEVKGTKGTLYQEVSTPITLEVKDGSVIVSRPNDDKDVRAKHGLYRALINNMIEGVSKGFTLQQELVGVGYRAKAAGQILELSLGYSHPIVFELPTEIKVKAETEKGKNPTITLESFDKQLLGMVAAKIRSFRQPEPYKGKGIRFVGESIRRKAGKAAGKK